MYGDNLALMGGFAEYAIAADSALAHKPPAGLLFAEASTIPQAGAIALQGRSLGADVVIDHRHEDFTRRGPYRT